MSPAALRHGGLFPPDRGSKRTGTSGAGRNPTRGPDRAVAALDCSAFTGSERATTPPPLLIIRRPGSTTLATPP